MIVFHVPDAVGVRSAGKNKCFSCSGYMWGAGLQVKMNVFHVPDAHGGRFASKINFFNVPDTCGGRFAGRSECFSCSGYMWGPVQK